MALPARTRSHDPSCPHSLASPFLPAHLPSPFLPALLPSPFLPAHLPSPFLPAHAICEDQSPHRGVSVRRHRRLRQPVQELIAAGLFKQIAVEIRSGLYERVSLSLLAKDLGAKAHPRRWDAARASAVRGSCRISLPMVVAASRRVGSEAHSDDAPPAEQDGSWIRSWKLHRLSEKLRDVVKLHRRSSSPRSAVVSAVPKRAAQTTPTGSTELALTCCHT